MKIIIIYVIFHLCRFQQIGMQFMKNDEMIENAESLIVPDIAWGKNTNGQKPALCNTEVCFLLNQVYSNNSDKNYSGKSGIKHIYHTLFKAWWTL